MTTFDDTARAFVEMAHTIVWAVVATVDAKGRPRSRILHPLWELTDDDATLTGWVATSPTPVKLAHLARSPFVSVTYWSPDHDTCTAECHAELLVDDATRRRTWDAFTDAPAPVGYDPAIVPAWRDGATSPGFAVMRLVPWRLRVFPGTVLLGRGGTVRTWPGSD